MPVTEALKKGSPFFFRKPSPNDPGTVDFPVADSTWFAIASLDVLLFKLIFDTWIMIHWFEYEDIFQKLLTKHIQQKASRSRAAVLCVFLVSVSGSFPLPGEVHFASRGTWGRSFEEPLHWGSSSDGDTVPKKITGPLQRCGTKIKTWKQQDVFPDFTIQL